MNELLPQRLKATLVELHGEAAALSKTHAGSILHNDIEALTDEPRRSIVTYGAQRAFGMLELSFEGAADASKMLDPPATPRGSLGGVRAGIAASGRIVWLTDRTVEASERLRRAYATLNRDVNEEIAFSETGGEYDGPGADVVEYGRVWAREEQARWRKLMSRLQLGKVAFEGDEECASRLGLRFEYELFSNVTHAGRGGLSVVQQRLLGSQEQLGEYLILVLAAGVTAYGRAVWSLANYRGDQALVERLRGLLSRVSDSIRLSDDARAYFN